MRTRRAGGLISAVIVGAFAAHVSTAQRDTGRNPDWDWPTYNRDLAGTRYSPLTQINTTNVSTLTRAWSYRLRPEPGAAVPAIDKPASSFEMFQEVTPIVVNGVMYLPSGNRVVALEPETGKEIWRYELPEGLASFRGVAYWPGEGRLPPRILFTSLKKLMALDARTGRLDVEFGNRGHVDLEIAYSGVPAIYRNVILMGSNFFGPGERHIGPHLTTSKGEKGDTHAYDARTGEKLWDFHTIPLPGEVGNDTWGNDSWRNRTGNNVWSFTLTVDEQRGLVYLPVSGPGMNYYGGDRPGNNLFSNTTVALDAQTGTLKWYFQNIRHELWDYNLPPAPGLIDIRKDGKTIPALAQVGKSGFMFILNREDGTPVHGVDERPMAKGDVPGEWYPATQPIPRKPGPVARVSMTSDDLVTAEDTTPAHAQACRELWDRVKFRNDGPYTPWNYRPNGGPPSVIFPGMTGGVNWGGTATDPNLGYIFVNSKDEPSTGWIAPNPRYSESTKDTEFPYVQQGGGVLSAPATDRDGNALGTLPCFRPPWASLMAVDAATGEFVWRVPLGVNDNMPEGKKNAGSPGYGGPIVTAGGLVFIGATRDRRFRAFDAKTGQELWSVGLDYNVTAIPMTYQGNNGKQYVAVVAATNGQGNNESLLVFALPSQPQLDRPARIAGHPDFNGVWQALNTAYWNLEDHPAEALPGKDFWQLGAIAAIPAGRSVVRGGTIPYVPAALAKRNEHRANWPAADPEAKCYMLGIPRATYHNMPFQIFQGDGDLLFVYPFAAANRIVHMKDRSELPVDSWMGKSNGTWDGDVLVVTTRGQNDQTWLDRAGNHHSNKLTVTERFTLLGPNHIWYEATLDDPLTYSRPWTIEMPLYRSIEADAQLLEHKCVPFTDMLLYRDLLQDRQ